MSNFRQSFFITTFVAITQSLFHQCVQVRSQHLRMVFIVFFFNAFVGAAVACPLVFLVIVDERLAEGGQVGECFADASCGIFVVAHGVGDFYRQQWIVLCSIRVLLLLSSQPPCPSTPPRRGLRGGFRL